MIAFVIYILKIIKYFPSCLQSAVLININCVVIITSVSECYLNKIYIYENFTPVLASFSSTLVLYFGDPVDKESFIITALKKK